MGWCTEEFNNVDFGDARLTKRLKKFSQAMLDAPGKSIPESCGGCWAETKAAYRFIDNSKVSGSTLLEAHYNKTKERILGKEIILAIQDTTYLNLDNYKAMEGLGSVQCKRAQRYKGLMFHLSLAFSVNGYCLGLLGYKLYLRDDFQQVKKGDNKHKPIHNKESYRWVETLK